MKTISTIFFFFIVIVVLIFSCKKKDEYANLNCSTISSAYTANIKPIITANCNFGGCHNAGSVNGDFTTYAGLKTAADNGNLSTRALEDKNMPASGPLSTDDRDKIKCWLNNGAPNN